MPEQIQIRGTAYERYSVRGRVVASRPSDRAGPGAGGRPTLRDGRGRTHRLPAEAWGGHTEEGHELTAVWLVRPDQGSGPYVAVRNHTTGQTWYNDDALARLHRPTWVLFLGVAAAAVAGLTPAGLVLVGVGVVGWYLGGIEGRRLLKGSGRLLRSAANAAAGQGKARVGDLHRP